MQYPLSILIAIMLGLPRTAATYVLYVVGPILAIRWTSPRALITVSAIVAYLALVLGLNFAVGLNVSPVAWLLELALILPFLLALCGLGFAKRFDGRVFIRALNLIAVAMSLVTLVRMGFPFQLPYVHYLPDAFDGGYGGGGAKIVTVIGFFGLAECLSRRRDRRKLLDLSLVVATCNFIIPNFILGIVAGACGLAIFARKNRSIVLVGAALAFLVVPYIVFRAETKNNAFSEYYGSNPKIYAMKIVSDVYMDHPQTLLIGSGIGQFGGEAAIWASPTSSVFGSGRVIRIPYLTSSDIHRQYLAPILMRFRGNVYAVESSSNKPYSGISIMLVELGLPLTLLIIYILFVRFWRYSPNDFGKACFLYFLAMNLLDPQVDSVWYGMLMLAAAQALQKDRREAARFAPFHRPQQKNLSGEVLTAG